MSDHRRPRQRRADDERGDRSGAYRAHQSAGSHIYVGRDAQPVEGGKLSDLAPTMLTLMGMDVPPEMTGKPLMILK